MTEILQPATAGTMESSDVLVEIEPNQSGLDIQLESVVLYQFGDAIERSVRDTLKKNGVENARLTVTDRGALDCVIRARVETAISRAAKEVK